MVHRNGNASVLMQLTEEADDLEASGYHYSLHVIDNITDADCEIYFTQSNTAESVEKLIMDVISIIHERIAEFKTTQNI